MTATLAKKKTDIISLSIPCLSDYIGIVRLVISGVATRMNYTIEAIDELKLAVSEACINATQYAFDSPETEEIAITYQVSESHLRITVTDTGKGFDVTSIKEGSIDLERLDVTAENPRLGLGLTFIRSMMDETDIKSKIGKGTSITMIKNAPTTQ